MHTRTTAGQATIEYVAAIALIAVILVLAAPAVGAPDLGKAVVGKFRFALCVVGGDVCSSAQAHADGLSPCPLKSDLKGHEASVTAFSVEVGHRWTLTVTPQSDGSVQVVRTASGTVGAAGGLGGDFSAGPVKFEFGQEAGARARVQAAFGWDFKDQASADRFLEHAQLNTANLWDFPSTWQSVESGAELSAMLGISGGAKGASDRGELFGLGSTLSGALGGRKTRDGMFTIYGRAAVEGVDISFPFLPSIGRGREDWTMEYTFGHGQARELVFRHGEPSDGGNRLTETVMRLDLRDPANLAAAKPLLNLSWPWPESVKSHVGAVLRRITTDGIVETSVSDVDDNTAALSGSVSAEVEFGAGAKRINVHRKLLSATARDGGPYERQRFDCVPRG